MPLRQTLDGLITDVEFAKLDLSSHAKRLHRLERRLGKSLLDSFVSDFFEPVTSIPIGFGAHSELTIASGLVTKTFVYHSIDTQADAASDNLAGVQNGKDGDLLIIRPDSDARSIVVKHNDVAEGTAGSRIFLNDDADLTLDDVDDTLTLIYDETLDSASGAWAEVARGQQAHTLLGATHTDTLAGTVVDGDVIIGNATPKWSRLAISIPAANVRNVLGIDNAELRPSWKTVLDATAPSTSAVGDAATAGTSLLFSHRDHVHGREAFATNTVTLGTAAAAGSASTLIRSDAGIAAFDVTAPTTIAPSDTPTAGIINFAARRDHLHGAPATFPATAHNVLSATHGDSTAAAIVRGDVVVGIGVAPKWERYALSVPAANVRNVLGVDNAEVEPTWKTALDSTNPANIATAASPGTSLLFAHRDHVHAHPDLASDLHSIYLLATGARTGATSQAQSFGALGILADVIAESTGAAGVTIDGALLKDDSLFLTEKAAALLDVAGEGQWWVKSDVPNTPYFTDDAGNDRALIWSGGAFHDGFSDFVSDEHVAHAGVVLTAGVGLSGGGDISASRTFTVDLNELTTEASIAAGDFLAMVDITDSGSGKITFANLEATISHDNIAGVSTSDHHVKYTDAEAIAAVEGEATLNLTGALAVTGTTTVEELISTKSTLTIDANDEVTVPTTAWVYLTSAGATDSLDGIGAGTEGQIVILTPVAGKDITLVHNGTVTAGKPLLINGEANVLLDQDHDMAIAVYDATALAWNVFVDTAGAGAAHNIFSATHSDTTGAASPVDGDIIIGNVTPAWSKLAISVPAANVRNVLGIDNAELRPSWKTALDTTAPTTIAEGAVAAAGTSLVFSHRDHTHGAPATWAATAHALLGTTHSDILADSVTDGDIIIGNATPKWSSLAISVPAANVRNVLGIDNAELRPSWKTALDATNPADIAAAASPGTSLVFAHRDHVHAHPNLGDLHTGYLLATGARTGSTAGAQSFGATGIALDVIAESTAAAGVTVDGVLLKDDYIEVDEIAAPGAGTANKLRLYAFTGGSGAAARLATVDELGVVLHPFMGLTQELAFVYGSAQITINSGTRNATVTVTHNQGWSSAGAVFVVPNSIGTFALAELPMALQTGSITVNAFNVQAIALSNVGANRTFTFYYICTGII